MKVYPKKSLYTLSSDAQSSSNTAKTNKTSFCRREQIKRLLINNFRKKYGATNRSELDSAITQEVESMLGKEKVHQSYLRSIEKKIRGMAAHSVNHDRAQKSNVSAILNNTTAAIPNTYDSSLIIQNEPKKAEEYDKPFLPSIKKDHIIVLPPKIPRKNNWDKILEYDVLQHEENLKKEQERELLRKQRIKEELEKQIRDKLNAKQTAKQRENERDKEFLKQRKLQEEERELKETAKVKEKIVRESLNLTEQLKGSVA